MLRRAADALSAVNATSHLTSARSGAYVSSQTRIPSRENHEPERPRKLLAHRREIERLIGRINERGLTLVPTRIYFSGPRAKVEIALARGKDRFDKREAIKARDQRRDVERELRDAGR